MTEFNLLKKCKQRHNLICHVFKIVSYYIFPRKCRLLTLSLGFLFGTRKKKKIKTLTHTFAASNLNPVQILYLACTQFKLPLLSSGIQCSALQYLFPLLDILRPPTLIAYHQMKGLIQHKEAVSLF